MNQDQCIHELSLEATFVAQIFNLLYRGIAFCSAPAHPTRFDSTDALPSATRRYSRLKICATDHRQLVDALTTTSADFGFSPTRQSGDPVLTASPQSKTLPREVGTPIDTDRFWTAVMERSGITALGFRMWRLLFH